jgi:sulfur-oxidizing protein SoxZ
VKLLISHPMESGQRRDDMGQAIPRDIINSFVCTFDGDEVLRADLFPAIAANPFLSFAVVVQESGTLAMTFTDDHGAVQTETASVTVE